MVGLLPTLGAESGLNPLVSGFVSGVIMWGDDNPVNRCVRFLAIRARAGLQPNQHVHPVSHHMGLGAHGCQEGLVSLGACHAAGLMHCAVFRVGVYKYAYPLYAGIIWAFVMYLFHYQEGRPAPVWLTCNSLLCTAGTLQSSLISSMTYLYNGDHLCCCCAGADLCIGVAQRATSGRRRATWQTGSSNEAAHAPLLWFGADEVILF
jgi:hypothetical protein